MKTIITALFVLTLSLATFAAGEIDPTFNGGATQTNGIVTVFKRQTDGKILVVGGFEALNGSAKNSIARLNADGTIDATFNPPNIVGTIRAVEIQPNGKILIGGNFVIPLLTNNTFAARLNADGSFDNTFSAPTLFTADQNNAVYDIAVAVTGKIYIAGTFYQIPNNPAGTRSKFARLNADGTLDMAYAPTGTFADIFDIEIQSDGKVVGVITDGGGSNVRFIKRFNPDGTEDFSFNALVTTTNLQVRVNALKIQADGKILIAGTFSFVNNTARGGAARLNADGTLDSTFNVTSNGTFNDVDIDADGKILLGGVFSTFNGVAKINLVRLDANGNLDNSFADTLTNSLNGNDSIIGILPLPDGKILASLGAPSFIVSNRTIRFNANGTVDNSFALFYGTRGTVAEIVVQPDGKILVAGSFGAINSLRRINLGRFNADGSPDSSFNPPITGNNFSTVRAIALQADGKVLVGGQSTNLPALFRLNPDGSRDNTFTANIPEQNASVNDITIQPDGKILAGGSFGNFTPLTRRYNADGTTDNTFSAIFTGTASGQAVHRIVLQSNGKILVGGEFTTINGSPRGRIARLNADGTLDTTFNPLGGANSTVYEIAVQTDGKIIIGGSFTSYNGSSRNYLARLNPDGNLDGSFAAVSGGTVRAVKIESNGKIIVGDTITESPFGTSRSRIVRLNVDGTLDATFNPGAGLNGLIYTLAFQADGKLLAGGSFTMYNNAGKVSIVRLLNDSNARRTLFDFDGDRRADLAVFRPSNGFWYVLPSQTNGFYGFPFGQNGDQIAPADYDGDGKTDIAVFRGSTPGAGVFAYFYITNSADNTFRAVQFGATGDVPVVGDYDGDGKADLAVYRENSGGGLQSFFYYRPSSQPGVDYLTIALGGAGDKPQVGDFDGDGKNDAAVFRSFGTASWVILRSSDNQITQTNFGVSTDIPVPADYDGDGTTNIAVFRPSTGFWYTSTNPQLNFGAVQFGANGDMPVPADYDGDGRADVAVFRPSNGAWFLNRSTAGFTGVQFGANGDKPAPNAFIR